MMQREIAAANPRRPVRLFGVADVGSTGATGAITTGRTIPMVQDTAGMMVSTAWATVLRDVVILDARNHRVSVYNLSEHNLALPENYMALKTMLLGLGNAM